MNESKEFLKEYDDSKYKKPSATVDMIILTAVDVETKARSVPDKVLRVLLIKRKGDPLVVDITDPYKGKWALPGGFVNYYEDLDAAAIRELREETNISDVYMEQLYTWGKVYRDLRRRVISTSYMALVDSSKLNIKAGDDAEDACWFDVKITLLEEVKTQIKAGYIRKTTYELSLVNSENEIKDTVIVTKKMEGRTSKIDLEYVDNPSGLAFDHATIIFYALERLKNKVEYTDIAFSLMPEMFTLTELKKLYEVITGKVIYSRNFRDKMEKQKKMVIETDEWESGKPYKPARLFRFNPDWVEDQ
ncbi:NUDIX domain-containing protein [Sporomusa sp. GT1]|uniref:NUDIX hydrolase n=1 Tax=Sporomusa sp. GT1 TaxID=1534747 RepID=UPI00166631D1|nr:NUDIX domain-containing protein [Sporomusa sp. GT1]